MRITTIASFLILGVIALGLTTNNAYAELSINNAFILEGTGFAITEESIKTTEIDFAMSTGNQIGSTISILIEDGFITLDDEDFIGFNLEASGLREGRFIRISGTAEDSFGGEISMRLFGRLIENSVEGSIYSFTGRLTHENESHKIIYTTKLSGLSSISLSTPTSSTTEESSELVIHILRGSSTQGVALNYIQAGELRTELIALAGGDAVLRLGYFFPDRISIDPGTSVTFVNDDNVAHRIVSGQGLGTNSRASLGAFVLCETPSEELQEGVTHSSTGCSFTIDGRIDTGTLQPGESRTVSFDDAGFYRMINPDYPWMNLVAYSFPDTGSEVIRSYVDEQAGN